MTRQLAALVREQLQRLLGTFSFSRSDDDLADELRAHLELAADAEGAHKSAEQATRTDAPSDAKALLPAMEALRGQRSLPWLDDLLCDLRDAVQGLRYSPGFATLAIVTLALGIGAVTAVFSAFDAVALRPVSVHDPATLVRFSWVGANDVTGAVNVYGYSARAGEQQVEATFPYPIYQAFLKSNHTLSDLAACAPALQLAVAADGRAEMATGLLASANYFELLGVRPEGGRTFKPTDDTADAPTVAVISDGYWRRRFGGNQAVIGSTMAMNGVPVTIVGVTPRSFAGIQRVPGTAPDVTVPLSAIVRFVRGDVEGSLMLHETLHWWLELVGRMKPGVTPEQVRRDLATAFQTSARQGWKPSIASLAAQAGVPPPSRDGIRVPALRVASASRGIDDVSPDRYQTVGILAIVAALVLLLACVNLANLLLARAAVRRRELWIRLSMGATAGRLVRQLLVESALLALLGGALGVLLALRANSLLPAGIGRFPPLDSRALLFAAATTAAAAIAIGVMPAVRLVRQDLAADADERWRSGRARFAQALVVAQVALSIVLLVGAGLFQRTVDHLQHVDVGFESSRLLLVNVSPPLNSYDRTRVLKLYARLIDRLTRVPGVVRATLSRPAPLSGAVVTAPLIVDGHTPSADGRSDRGEARRIRWMMVDPNFFETWDIPVVAGRAFTSTDVADAPQVVIVNEAAARNLFPGDSAIGHRMSDSPGASGTGSVVGVVADARYDSLREPAPPTMYVPYAQEMARWGGPQPVTFALRTAGGPTTVAAAVRDAARNVDPDVPVGVSTEPQQIALRSAREQMFAGAYTSAGAIAVLLATIGLFGLISYRVVRQGREIGIRIALGAWRDDVVRMVIGESLTLVGVGIVIGLVCVVTMGPFVDGLLFDVAPTDAGSVVTAVAVMIVLAVAASYLPARRASRVDAMVQLRCE
jgi:predicted permease